MPDSRSSPGGYLYRGVHAGHPRNQDARNGIVYPGDVSGTITAAQHNAGDVSSSSPYTSWSTRLEVARKNAYNYGGGGVVLRVKTLPKAGAGWHWVDSPDIFDEGERLLFGIRLDIEVLEP